MAMATEQTTPRHWRPRFSLLALLLAVVFVGACGGLWWRWEPWVRAYGLKHPGQVGSAGVSPDGRCFFIGTREESTQALEDAYLVHVHEIETGRKLFTRQLCTRPHDPPLMSPRLY